MRAAHHINAATLDDFHYWQIMNLLDPRDPEPVIKENLNGNSSFVLSVDHAGRDVPAALGRLGVSDADFERHIAWDIGILETSRRLSAHLDAPLIGQRYSRLVIDCNRQLGVSASIPEISDETPIPGNRGITAAQRKAREDEIFHPYHRQTEELLQARRERTTLYVAMHSFTPHMAGYDRPWHVGLLTYQDRRLAVPILTALNAMEHLTVGDNDPYAVSPTEDYGLMVHGHHRGLLHVGFEIRQDLIAHEEGQIEWAERLATVLQAIPIGMIAPAAA